MRTKAAALVIAALSVAGCDEGGQYLQTGLAARGEAVSVGDSFEADRKLQGFRAKNGRDPASLEELESAEGKLKAPYGKHWEYDPAGARLTLVDGER
jgi:hypothetical protein